MKNKSNKGGYTKAKRSIVGDHSDVFTKPVVFPFTFYIFFKVIYIYKQ